MATGPAEPTESVARLVLVITAAVDGDSAMFRRLHTYADILAALEYIRHCVTESLVNHSIKNT